MEGLARLITVGFRHPTAIGLAIVVIIGTLASWVSGLPLWAGCLIALFGLLVNGLVILFEEED